MNQFYSNTITTISLSLVENEYHHCKNVFRKKINDSILVFDGQGGKYDCLITEFTKNEIICSIVESNKVEQKNKIEIALAPTKKNEPLEWAIEKLCELGVSSVSFIETKRTERTNLNYKKLENIALNACKQSGNRFLLKINAMQNFKNYVEQCNFEHRYIASLEAESKSYDDKNYTASVLIGPEGDFTKEEYHLANEYKFIALQLNQNVLRTETAAIVAAAILLK